MARSARTSLRGITDAADPAEWETEIGWPIVRTRE